VAATLATAVERSSTTGGGSVRKRPGGPLPAPLSASLIDERYRVLGPVGVGAMGEVYRVLDRELDAVLAMKVMRPELATRADLRRRFQQETRITAQLRHPSVVTVQNRGELPDGRLWFTMTLVRGRSLRSILGDLRALPGSRWLAETSEGWTVQRLVHAFSRICATIGYAHSLGIVHRDIKPANVMLGSFGEIVVMDWGVARKVGEPDFHTERHETVRVSADGTGTLDGQIVGTPIYMAPEQFLGAAGCVGKAADVWGLGAMLYELLAGRTPYRSRVEARAQGSIRPLASTAEEGMPVGIPELCMRMLSRDPLERPGAAEVADELVRWLDGSARRSEARKLVAAADPQLLRVRRAYSQLRVMESRWRDARAGLGRSEPVERLRPVWALEARVEAAAAEAKELDQQLEDAYRAAWRLAPDEPASRVALARLVEERLGRAERRGDEERSQQLRHRLAKLDPARHSRLTDNTAWLSLDSSPTGARVVAFRYEEQDHRLVLVRHGELGCTPLRRVALPAGSWLLELRAPGHAPARLPVVLRRGRHRQLRDPSSGAEVAVPLLRGGWLPADTSYVPPGYFLAGGDPQGLDALPRSELWTDGFLVARHLVTRREVGEWLRDLVRRGQWRRAQELCPRLQTYEPSWTVTPRGVERRDSRHTLHQSPPEMLPATGFTLEAASAFARWRGRRDGVAWTPPHDLLWERAARGADGRVFSWGDRFEASFSNNAVASLGNRPMPSTVPLHDVGPFGLVGACGHERELCLSGYRRELPRPGARIGFAPLDDEDLRWLMVRGGSHKSQPHFLRLACRFAGRRSDIVPWAGLRLFAPVPDGATATRAGLIDAALPEAAGQERSAQ
jgi:serine/threonine-protein kinase